MHQHNSTEGPRIGGPFEIGLVLSGAISAGAYTAGVVDFLIQALDAFQEAKKAQDPNCPHHDVRLRVLSGASAGGMTAALSAGLLFERFQHAVDSSTARPTNNTLFDSWVNQIDATELLAMTDLMTQPEVRSLLDSTILSKIASRAFEFDVVDHPPDRSYLADPLEILLTLTNLRGVPYAVNFASCPASTVMTLHADRMHFAVGKTRAADAADIISLEPRRYRSQGWEILRQAAIASGAFPFGLAPRTLRRSSREAYAKRFANISPCWPEGMATEYVFHCVDGGVIDNAPMSLAREVLAQTAGTNRQEGHLADYALILVEAFPSTAEFARNGAFQERPDVLALAGLLAVTLLNQARFKYDELHPAEDPAVFNRFMIAPLRRRGGDRGKPEDYPLACGSLGGFGGFLDRAFRVHDFQLGRRNCQRFLQRHFALPSEGPHRNPLFESWSDAAKRRFSIQRARGQYHAPERGEAIDSFLPIIPLVGDAAKPVDQLPTWPAIDPKTLRRLETLLATRVQAVVKRLIDKNVQGWISRRLLSNAWWFKRSDALKSVTSLIRRELRERDQLGR